DLEHVVPTLPAGGRHDPLLQFPPFLAQRVLPAAVRVEPVVVTSLLRFVRRLPIHHHVHAPDIDPTRTERRETEDADSMRHTTSLLRGFPAPRYRIGCDDVCIAARGSTGALVAREGPGLPRAAKSFRVRPLRILRIASILVTMARHGGRPVPPRPARPSQ